MPTFSREERLKSLKTIARLFKGGESFMAYPIRVVWLLHPVQENNSPLPLSEPDGLALPEFPAQVVVAVPKKNFKTAVARNRLKRRIREAWRLHKQELYERLGERRTALMLMYIAKEELPFSEIENGVKKLVRKFPLD